MFFFNSPPTDETAVRFASYVLVSGQTYLTTKSLASVKSIDGLPPMRQQMGVDFLERLFSLELGRSLGKNNSFRALWWLFSAVSAKHSEPRVRSLYEAFTNVPCADFIILSMIWLTEAYTASVLSRH